MQEQRRRITGSVRIEDRKGGRVWVAKYMQADGRPTRRVLGRAWAKDSGRKTARGGTIWRAADGSKPDGYLTPAEADEALGALLAGEKAKPAVAPADRTKTLGHATDAFLSWHEREKGTAQTTLRRYRGIIEKHVHPQLGAGTPLRRLTPQHMADFRDWLVHDSGLGADSARQALVVLRGSLARARRKGWLAVDLLADVEAVHVPKPDGTFNVLSPEEVEAIAREAAKWSPVKVRGSMTESRAEGVNRDRQWIAQRNAALIRFGVATGLRIGELRALRWRDVQWDISQVHVQRNAPSNGAEIKAPKSGRRRSVPLGRYAAEQLEALSRVTLYAQPDDLVFASSGGGLLGVSRLRTEFRKAVRAAGLGHMLDKDDPLTVHDLRHTFASRAVKALPLTTVQAYMGHSDIATTMRYVHHVPGDRDAQLIDQALGYVPLEDKLAAAAG